MDQYFPELYEQFSGNVKVELDIFTYAMKADLKGATRIDIFTLASKNHLANLKTKVDNLDVDRLKSVPVDLGKLGDVMDNDAVKKNMYNNLLTKVNANDRKTTALLD